MPESEDAVKPVEIPAPGVIVAIRDENDVTFDVEPVKPGEVTRFFCSTCHDHDGRRKEIGVDTNLMGFASCFVAGNRKTVRAISYNVLEGVADKLRAQFRVAGEPCGGWFDLAPNEITPLALKNVRTCRPPSRDAVPDKDGFFLVDMNELVLEGLEWFAVDVVSETCARLKINLHGPLDRPCF